MIRKANPAHEILKPRVGMKSIQHGVNFEKRYIDGPLFERPFQPSMEMKFPT